MVDVKILSFTENTLFKVYDVLRNYGLSEEVSRDIINDMQNKGILFREMLPRSSPYRALGSVQDSLLETRTGLRDAAEEPPTKIME